MAILRAGPWGNLSDSFQNVPGATNVPLTYYPVNIAKANWPNQDWTAWYEVEGCCNGDISVSWSYFHFGDYATRSYTETLTAGSGGDCNYERETDELCSYYGTVLEYLYVSYNGTYWQVAGGSQCFASGYGGANTSITDPCDPSGTYEIFNDGGFPVGVTWTITSI